MGKVLAITGYKAAELNIRSNTDDRINYIKQALEQAILSFIENGTEWIVTSGQIGVELWACQVVNKLSSSYPIKYAVIPPFENQQKWWSEANQEAYQQIIDQAHYYALLYQGEYQGAYQFSAKNKWLLDKSDASLILVDEEFPGSVQYFLKEAKAYQKQSDYLIRYITPFDLEEIAREYQANHDW
ncbi:SLOG family protein [Amphibacillus sediminis]|uniref:SLOG family protein n=1 Tax=Amphibacillus sediminis TaxID=360185 RepID=UPI00082DC81C|nr:SLOG family protein [Amphibacillus sediminis]